MVPYILVSSYILELLPIGEDAYHLPLVEQNASLALSLAKKAYVLEIGRVVLEGDAKELEINEHVKKFYLGM